MSFSIHLDLGPNIKLRRKALEYSQSELAHGCGLTAGSVSHYETGIREPSLTALIKISSMLGCTVSDLIGQTKSPIHETRCACQEAAQAQANRLKSVLREVLRNQREGLTPAPDLADRITIALDCPF